MDIAQICLLPDRGVIELAGPDSREFLQGLITNSMDLVSANRAIYAGLLTPQGKYLFDFFVVQKDDGFLIECEAARLPDLVKRLNFYRLRAKVTIRDASETYHVAACPGPEASGALDLPAQPGAARAYSGGIIFTDPRLAAMGARMILAPDALAGIPLRHVSPEVYHRLRLELGIAEGHADIEVEKYFLLEANFEELNGVDFKKGCYVGQELVSRMKHRGVVRKRILPVHIEGACPPPGTPILAAGREVGVLRSGMETRALAFLRLSALAPGAPALSCSTARLTPHFPDWMTLTVPELTDEQD